MSHRHELAGRETVALDDLRDRPLISLPQGTGLRARLDEVCAAAGLTPHIAFEASDPLLLAQFAARGLGLAVLPESVAVARPAVLRSLPIAKPELRGRLALAWRAEGPAGPAARALVRDARAALRTRADS